MIRRVTRGHSHKGTISFPNVTIFLSEFWFHGLAHFVKIFGAVFFFGLYCTYAIF